MFRAALRTTPRALRQPTVASATGRRFASTAPADKRYTWKGTATRWGLAIGALYWYSTSAIFADELPARLSSEPAHFSESDLITVDAIVEEKRKTLDARLKAKAEQAAKNKAAQPPPPPQGDASTGAAATAEDVEKSPEQVEEEAGQQGAFNPETGEINWDCPCLGGMAHGPCGEEFKSAFSCFVYSTEEVKGMDCVDKFQHMQDCFRKYPEIYGEEIADEQAAEREAEAAAAGSPAVGGDGDSTSSKDAVSTTLPSAKPEKQETPAVAQGKRPSEDASLDQKAHDSMNAASSKTLATDAPKPAVSASPVTASEESDAIPKRSYDATSANAKASK